MLQEYFSLFEEQLLQISVWEGIAVMFGVLEVLFAKFNKVWLYPCGLVNIIITVFLFFEARLYAEILLQMYYLAMSIYGWFLWLKRNGKTLSAGYSSPLEWKISIGIVFIFFSVLYVFLRTCTNSDVPLWDSFVSAAAWAGMWLLAKRKIENWILLNISNFFAVPLLIHKGLALYALLTVIYFIIAVWGYFDWKKIIAKQKING
ncbi:MAG: nicotinamide riboside transporter PnuC [Flavobacteriaceae bacterium]|jgi:nicotinamide mononucleotide transporter|nr:nicotinamide riboside transporter PnuC [Flavobacteriaceae bacterium]